MRWFLSLSRIMRRAVAPLWRRNVVAVQRHDDDVVVAGGAW